MPSNLNLFPAQAPIGRVVDGNGRSFDVLMTREFSRALSDLMVRLGGVNNYSTDELATLISTEPGDVAALAALQGELTEQANQVASTAALAARVAALEKQLADVLALASGAAPTPVDWEHPGKVGAGSANTGKFTTLAAQSLNKVIVTQPANSATLTLADGKTLRIDNTVVLQANDGAVLVIGGGGTLGSAAFRNGGSAGEDWTARQLTVASWFGCNGKAPQSSKASGGTLAGVIQALVENGILSS